MAGGQVGGERHRWRWWQGGILVLIATIVPTLGVAAQAAPLPPPGALSVPAADNAPAAGNDRFGLAHISYGSQPAEPYRYQQALATGVRWNRWAAYWHDVETAPGKLDFSKIDATLRADRAQGLELDVVLMGTPGFYATTTTDQARAAGPGITPAASAPRNLDLPVFADGSDRPTPGKAINPDNYWARYVASAVARYKDDVRYWELWNEPDLSTFWWTGDGQEVKHYARLLKVGYLAAKAMDPQAQILMGGLMYWQWANRLRTDNAWLKALLSELAADPEHDRHGYYFDVVPLHWYARPSDLYDKSLATRRLLQERGLGAKRIWINEANLPVCGDPALQGKPDCTPGVAKGELEDQAAFILQASADALAAGVDKLFFFQLFDDSLGAFEYYGLVRNDQSRRPAYRALQVVTQYFRNVISATKASSGPVEAVTILTRSYDLLVVMWNGGPDPVRVAIPARVPSALLIDQSGDQRPLEAADGAFAIDLPGATLNVAANGAPADYAVGGRTYLVVQKARS